jgi:hypothetical protein
MALLTRFAKMPLKVLPGLRPGSGVFMLLDGDDEAQGADVQRDIIRPITVFAQDAPLTWIIASHPEPHIATASNEMATSNRSEFMRINLTEIKFKGNILHYTIIIPLSVGTLILVYRLWKS